MTKKEVSEKSGVSRYRDFAPGEVDPTNKCDRDTFVWFMNSILNERERRLVDNCCEYAHSDPAGLPGHNLMVIIHKLDTVIGFLCDETGEEALQSIVALVRQ